MTLENKSKMFLCHGTSIYKDVLVGQKTKDISSKLVGRHKTTIHSATSSPRIATEIQSMMPRSVIALACALCILLLGGT